MHKLTAGRTGEVVALEMHKLTAGRTGEVVALEMHQVTAGWRGEALALVTHRVTARRRGRILSVADKLNDKMYYCISNSLTFVVKCGSMNAEFYKKK
jgi:hypothetical protein